MTVCMPEAAGPKSARSAQGAPLSRLKDFLIVPIGEAVNSNDWPDLNYWRYYANHHGQ